MWFSEKVPAYAGSGIPVCWLVNLRDRRVEVLTDPDPTARRYRLKQVASEGDVLSLPGGQSLAIVDILPPF